MFPVVELNSLQHPLSMLTGYFCRCSSLERRKYV